MVTSTEDTGPHSLNRAERWLWRHRKGFGLFWVILLVLDEVGISGFHVRRWDWLLVTGALLYLALLPISLLESRRVSDTLARLSARRAVWPANDSLAVEAAMHRQAGRWATIGGIVVMPVALGVWWWAYASSLLLHAGLAVIEIIASVPIGRFAGRAIAYGRLGRRLDTANVEVAVTPGHLDGAGGLRPVGDLYLFNATIIGAVAAYLAVWWLITPVVFPRYLPWRHAYLALLGLMLVLELLAFLAPMSWFHRRMQAVRRRLQMSQADDLSQQASTVEDELLRADVADRTAMQEKLELVKSRYREIEQMPTWPVSVAMRRRFAVRNLLLVVPIVANAASEPTSWQSVLNQLSKTVSGG